MKNKILFLLLCFVSYKTMQAQTVVNYTATTAEIQNPGRGFYSDFKCGLPKTPSGFDANRITAAFVNTQRSTKDITLILALYYLGEFKTTNISAAYITGMQSDFDVVRANGAKLILRFAYNNLNQTHRHPDDASLAQVLTHIGQLKNVIQKNSDVILTVQTGFIGTYGEWYYTHPDFTNVSPAGSPNYTNRKKVSDSLLKILPVGKNIQIRAPYYKYDAAMYGNGSSGAANAISTVQAYDGTNKSRIGYHNDCFIANSTDYGTYVSSPITLDKDYIDQDGKYTINGGETCNDDVTYTACANAKAEMTKQHFTYLNNDYNTLVLDRWKNTTPTECFTEIKRNLGYRLQLTTGTYTDAVKQGTTLSIVTNFKNIGYATPYERKTVELILKNTSTSTTYTITLPTVDNRYWLPSATAYSINETVGMGNIPNGSYNLYLALRDTGVNIKTNPLYAIQFANTGTWDATMGATLLKNITVNTATTPFTANYTGANWFGPAIILPINLTNLTIKEVNNNAKLDWSLSSNSIWTKFDIERSENGIDFNFKGTVFATQNNTSYSYVDQLALNNTITYYKLKFYKQDGSFEYSSILKIRKGESATAIGNIYPLPAKDFISIELLNAVKDNNASIQIFDVQGKLLFSKYIALQDGFNIVNNINVSKILPGIYTIKVSNHDFNFVKKLIK
jgi:hypothetical protein